VFVDGCFWHACPEHGSKPRANEWYWGPKLIKNVERDRVNDAALILAGWTVVRLWEHVPIDEAVGTVVTALTATGGASGPANAAGPASAPGPASAADPAGPANAAGESTEPASPSDGTEPPNRIPPATDDSLG
jgi:hypothetical protein